MSSLEVMPDEPVSSGIEAFLKIDQAVLEAIPSAVYICSADGVVMRFNRRAVELWGRAPRPGTDERFGGAFRLYETDGRPLPLAEAPMETALRTGRPQRDKEVIIERPDGSRIVTLVNVEPLTGPSGRVQGAINCFQDITARKKSEDALRDSEHRYRQTLDALPAAIYTTDAAGRVTFYNREAAALAGREPELGKDEWCVSWKLFHDDGTPLRHDECPMAQALKEQRPIRGAQAIAERPDGQRVPFAPYPTPIFDHGGKMVGAVNMLVDLTERRDVDARRHLAEQAHDRMASIIETSDDAIVSKNLDGIIQSWNGGAQRLFGYKPDEIIGKSVLTLIPEELQAEEPGIIDRIRRGVPIDHYETVRLRKDGSRIDISLTVSPVKDANGVIVGASKIARDITERKRAEVTIARRMEEQAALYELTDRLHRAETLDHIHNAALDAIVRGLRCDRASILLLDDDDVMQFAAWRGLSDSYRKAVAGHSPWPADARYPQPVCIDDVKTAELSVDLKATVTAERIGALAFIPLVVGGRLIGKFMSYYQAPHAFAHGEIDLAVTIARQLAFSIERSRVAEARRQVEDSLRESERRLELALAAGRMGAWEWTIGTGRVIWSPVLEKIHGLAEGSFGGRFEDFKHDIHPEDLDQIITQIQHSAETGDDYHVVYRARHPDGTTRWLEAFGQAVLGWDGKPHKIAGVCMDITESKQVEEALRTREAELESIIDGTPFMLIRCDRDLRYRFVSTAYAALLGRRPEDIVGKTIAEVIGQDAFDTIRPHIETTLRGDREEYESEVPYAAIGTRFLHVVYTPERDNGGQITGWIASILDVTERKRAESQRDLLVAELSHRVKNTLATVISIARQSFSKGPSIEDARRSFDGRILALAQTHGRLAEENWSGVSFETMLLDEFAPYRGDDGGNVKLSGPSLTLNPRCAVVLGMAVHELTTNAAKYGALSNKTGVVSVVWEVLPDRNLRIRWSEAGGPAVVKPERSGFGRLLLERALGSDLRGDVKLDFTADGLRCEIMVPLDGHVAYTNRHLSDGAYGPH